MIANFDLADGTLAYEVAGDSTASVVLLHSGPLNMRMWDPQFDHFAARWKTVRYDARGHGRSSSPTADFSHADDLFALLEHLGVARAHLVGASLGARTAIDFALTHPTRVESLVLASPGISGTATTDPFILNLEAALGPAIATMDAPGLIELVMRMWVDGPRRAAADVDPTLRKFCTEMAIENLPKQAAATGSVIDLHAAQRLDELACPILVVAGRLDSADIMNNALRLTGSSTNRRLVMLDGCGHQVSLEQPVTFTALCQDFIDAQQLREQPRCSTT